MSSKKPEAGELRRFWERQARRIGSFRHADSTGYYLEGEKRIIEALLPAVAGKRVLKLDLWSEVKNTNVLAWLAAKGAITHALDISFHLVNQARQEFRSAGLVPRFVVASIYDLPYRSGSFDFLYTMGTIEHVPDMERCVAEILRVLRPGGVAVVGVPNRRDPFLRPLLVGLLNTMGIYPYGLEQSLSQGQLRAMLSAAGFEILSGDGILFMPGVLRMAELATLEIAPPLSRLLGLCHWPFRLLARRFSRLNRHGYLLACAVRKPAV